MKSIRKLPEYYLGDRDAVTSDPNVYADAWKAFAEPLCDLLQADLVSCDPTLRFFDRGNDKIELSVPIAQRILAALREARLKPIVQRRERDAMGRPPTGGWWAQLRHVLAQCPEGHWLYLASGDLYMMRCGSDGQRVMDGDGADRHAIVESMVPTPVEMDGGDW